MNEIQLSNAFFCKNYYYQSYAKATLVFFATQGSPLVCVNYITVSTDSQFHAKLVMQLLGVIHYIVNMF